MQIEFLEGHVRTLYRMLNHGGDYTDCRCIDVNRRGPPIDRTILRGEDAFVKWAREYNGKANCFVGRNPRNQDGTVSRITSYTYDLDPIRQPGSAATDQGLKDALLAGRILLQESPSGYLASSGNGALVVYRLGIPLGENFKAFEQWLASREDALQNILSARNIQVKADHVHDTARIIKITGTMSTKGDKAHWRVSRFLDLPTPPFKSVCWTYTGPVVSVRDVPPVEHATDRSADDPAKLADRGQHNKGGRTVLGSVDLARINSALARLTAKRCDEYDFWLRVGLSLRSLGAQGLTLWEGWSKKSQRYQPGACEQKWATFEDQKEEKGAEPLTIGSLFYWADQDDPRGRLDRDGTISIADLSETEPTRWLCEGIIAKGSIGFVAGLPETMKTWLLMDLAIEAARGGGSWLGLFPVESGRVLFIDQERHKSETMRRFKLLTDGKGVNREGLRESLLLKCGTSIRLDLLPSYLALKTELLRMKPDLMIVDSFATFHTKDDTYRSEVQVVMERVKELRTEIGCAILFIDHETKQVFQDKDDGVEATAMRMVGSVGKAAAAELVLTVRRHDPNTAAIHHTKSTLGRSAGRFYAHIRDTENGVVLEGSR